MAEETEAQGRKTSTDKTWTVNVLFSGQPCSGTANPNTVEQDLMDSDEPGVPVRDSG